MKVFLFVRRRLYVAILPQATLLLLSCCAARMFNGLDSSSIAITLFSKWRQKLYTASWLSGASTLVIVTANAHSFR